MGAAGWGPGQRWLLAGALVGPLGSVAQGGVDEREREALGAG